jgi:hypothetical protein
VVYLSGDISHLWLNSMQTMSQFYFLGRSRFCLSWLTLILKL